MKRISRILQLCSRIEQQPLQQQLLLEACKGFSKWEELLHQAEAQGMGPLLHKHLAPVQVNRPDRFYRSLMLVSFRHQQANALLVKSLSCILRLLEDEGIPVIVLKGAALCQTLYPDIGLRPMRDIDLLFSKKDVDHAHALLRKNDFRTYAGVMPEDHFHLQPLYQSIDGLQICVELHHDLFPSCPPYYQSCSFTDLYNNALCFDAGGVMGSMFATEEMLWHLYEHGIHSPLSYEPFKFISVADIVGLVEKKAAEIDWDVIKSKYPHLFHALPLFHHLTPWSGHVLESIPPVRNKVPSGVGESFKGWPQKRLSQQKNTGIAEIVRRTFFPSQWWLRVYYGPESLFSVLCCRMVRHPRHIFWWIKLYWSIFLRDTLPESTEGRDTGNNRSISSSFAKAKVLGIAMYRKFKK